LFNDPRCAERWKKFRRACGGKRLTMLAVAGIATRQDFSDAFVEKVFGLGTAITEKVVWHVVKNTRTAGEFPNSRHTT